MGILAECMKTVSVAEPVEALLLLEVLAVLPCSTKAGSDCPGELEASAWKEELSNVPSVTECSILSSARSDGDELNTGSVMELDILSSALELLRERCLLPTVEGSPAAEK